MACSSGQICATVVLVTLIVIGTTLLVALTTVLPAYQTQTTPRSSWTTVTISPTEQNTTPTSAITGKTSFRPQVTLPRTTATPEEGTPSRTPFRTAWVPAATDHDARVVEEMRILGRIGGSEPGQFRNPRGVVVSAENEIFVADRFNHQVQVFDMEGALLRMFPTVMPDPHGFMVAPVDPVTPEDVSLDGRGNLWVVGKHATGNVAVRYARDGYPRGKIHLTMTAFTRGIAVNPKRGRVLVTEADGRVGEVLMFRPDGLLERRFGRQEGMLHPWYVATDTREGNILVSDYDTNYVYMYDHWGGFLAKFGGHFRHPDGLCVDVHGNIIVADQGNRRVEVLTSRGEHVRFVGRGLGKPSGVAVAPTGQLVVTYGLRSIVVIFTH